MEIEYDRRGDEKPASSLPGLVEEPATCGGSVYCDNLSLFQRSFAVNGTSCESRPRLPGFAILQSVRFRRHDNRVVEKPDGSEFYETIHFADSNVFNLFTFPLLYGDPQTALNEPYELVLNREMALKYFDRLDVVGEQLHLPEDSITYSITGVFDGTPANTHLKFDMLSSFETLNAMGQFRDSWWSFSTFTYLEIAPTTNIDALGEKIIRISANYIADQEESSGYYQEYYLQNLKDVHLHSDLRGEMEPNSKASYVYIFLTIGIFILVIACINFMNLATARSANRAREIAVRKVSGVANRERHDGRVGRDDRGRAQHPLF